MKTSLKKFFLLPVALGATAGSLTAAETWKLPPETARLKPGPGVELATGNCLLCHSADYISTQPRLPRAAWEASVKKMKEKYGAPVPADNTQALVDYLVKNYGAVPAAK